MNFYDRKDEIALLRQIQERSETSAQFTLLLGRRRVGKTALIREAFKKDKSLYLFVSKKTEALLCTEFQTEVRNVLNLTIFGHIERFRDLFEQLLIYSEEHPFTLILDEFQDFIRVNDSVFSEIQDLWDRFKDKTKMNLVVCGSIYSLMIRIFEDREEPLYGRQTAKIVLAPFTTSVIKKILKDYNPDFVPEDLLTLWMLTGGIPKFIALLMDAGAVTHEAMLRYATSLGSPFLTEGRDILVSEFGKDYSTYFSILQLIAAGKTSLNEMDSIIGRTASPYLVNLEQEYSLVRRMRPIFAKPESRNTKWRIGDAYLSFWFRFIYANQTLVEAQRFDLLLEIILRDYEQSSGRALEDYFKAKLMEEDRFTEIGSYWDRKGVNEIDIVAVSDTDRTALACEVKHRKAHIDLSILRAKAATLSKELARYDVTYKGLSPEDM